jgi:hypothetical protein
MLTNEGIAAIQARCEAATPGPCKYSRAVGEIWADNGLTVMGNGQEYGIIMAQIDAEFIVHTREDIPALLSALEAQTKRVDEAEQELAIHEGMMGLDHPGAKTEWDALILDRDRYKARAEALERSIKGIRVSCPWCVGNADRQACEYWGHNIAYCEHFQFDEARFAKGDENK